MHGEFEFSTFVQNIETSMWTHSKHSIYIGDHQIDITSGKSANMRTVAAAYGYIPEGDSVTDWDADFIIDHPLEINKIIETH